MEYPVEEVPLFEVSGDKAYYKGMRIGHIYKISSGFGIKFDSEAKYLKKETLYELMDYVGTRV